MCDFHPVFELGGTPFNHSSDYKGAAGGLGSYITLLGGKDEISQIYKVLQDFEKMRKRENSVLGGFYSSSR